MTEQNKSPQSEGEPRQGVSKLHFKPNYKPAPQESDGDNQNEEHTQQVGSDDTTPKKKRFKLSTLFWLTWSFLMLAKAFGLLAGNGKDFALTLFLQGIILAMVCGFIVGVIWVFRKVIDNA